MPIHHHREAVSRSFAISWRASSSGLRERAMRSKSIDCTLARSVRTLLRAARQSST